MSLNGRFVSGVRPPENRGESPWLLVFRGYRLLVQVVDGQVNLPSDRQLGSLGLTLLRRQYLGQFDGVGCYSAEVDEEVEAPEGWTFSSLRGLFGKMPEALFWLAGAALEIVEWDRTSQYCGRCGQKTAPKVDERAKQCANCGLVDYPRISPAIIVLVERDDSLLLARANRHPIGFYSVLAGFVEPGESLEEAVVREIREEVGIEVQDIQYFGSQPWPFPHSLMIAFTCRYKSGEIALDKAEMADAGWYKPGDLPQIPPKISIARQLIEWFLAKHGVPSDSAGP